MSATNRARPLEPLRETGPASKSLGPMMVPNTSAQPIIIKTPQPALRVLPLLQPTLPRRFTRVPTHAVGVYPEQREYPRASLKLPLRLRSVNHIREEFPITLVTRDLSSTGVFFLCPKAIAIGIPIELEIVLVSRPMGQGNVALVTLAHVRRIEPAATPGWHGIAASYDDVQFDRDDGIPSRFLLS